MQDGMDRSAQSGAETTSFQNLRKGGPRGQSETEEGLPAVVQCVEYRGKGGPCDPQQCR